jgi:hypothetical protein
MFVTIPAGDILKVVTGLNSEDKLVMCRRRAADWLCSSVI